MPMPMPRPPPVPVPVPPREPPRPVPPPPAPSGSPSPEPSTTVSVVAAPSTPATSRGGGTDERAGAARVSRRVADRGAVPTLVTGAAGVPATPPPVAADDGGAGMSTAMSTSSIVRACGTWISSVRPIATSAIATSPCTTIVPRAALRTTHLRRVPLTCIDRLLARGCSQSACAVAARPRGLRFGGRATSSDGSSTGC